LDGLLIAQRLCRKRKTKNKSLNAPEKQVITCSLDGTIRMHGLRSGKTIKFFRGHTAFVHRCLYVSGHGGIASVAMDATLRLWDKKTGDLLKTMTLAELEEKSGAGNAVVPNLGILDVVHGREKVFFFFFFLLSSFSFLFSSSFFFFLFLLSSCFFFLLVSSSFFFVLSLFFLSCF
jgi:WD40 repeat protein